METGEKTHEQLADLIDAYVGMARVKDIDSVVLACTTPNRETLIDMLILDSNNNAELARGLKRLSKNYSRAK